MKKAIATMILVISVAAAGLFLSSCADDGGQGKDALPLLMMGSGAQASYLPEIPAGLAQ